MKPEKAIDYTVQLNREMHQPLTSPLQQWPIQMHLISPSAPYYAKADVLLVADCVAYALDNFHSTYLKNNALAIACPKLDTHQAVKKMDHLV